MAAAVIGFVAVMMPLRMQRQSALRDLPVVESLDLYRYADNVEFLKMLDEADLFDEEDVDVP